MVSISTPKYTHLKVEDYECIYEPAEDSFLMMDALEKDYNVIKQCRPLICLEVGPGSGVLITFLATLIQHKAFYLASDINKDAAYATKKTGEENNIDANVTIDNLISSLKHRLARNVDVLLFNPPYVVTPSDEVGGTSLSASWAGGIAGREVIDKFLPVAMNLISDNGLLYLLLLKENKPDDIMEMFQKNGFHGSIIIQRKTGPEHLIPGLEITAVHHCGGDLAENIQKKL